MLDDERSDTPATPTQPTPTTPLSPDTPDAGQAPAPTRRRTTKKTAAAAPPDSPEDGGAVKPAAKTAAKRAAKTAAPTAEDGGVAPAARTRSRKKTTAGEPPAAPSESGPAVAATSVLFQPPEPAVAPPRKRAQKAAPKVADPDAGSASPRDEPTRTDADERAAASDGSGPAADADGGSTEGGGDRPARRRRGRRGRGGRGSGGGEAAADAAESTGSDGQTDRAASTDGEPAGDAAEADDDDETTDETGAPGSATRRRRRRRRRRTGEGESDGAEATGDEEDVDTVVHVREPRPAQKTTQKTAQKTAQKSARGGGGGGGGRDDTDDGVRGVKGSTRLEAKRQRRREGRDTGRRRPPIITEAEFLARRESVDRMMIVRQTAERTQIAVLEDGVLVEHYVARKDQTSMVGNVYLGKVQNVLPSMEAAFVDIGRGRNAVLYAGEVNYDASALEGRAPRIEQALKSGQSVLVQVTKDPIGHKGSRLTSQVSLPGRYMVYVPDGRLSGISRKLPDTERSRLKGILKRLTPEDAGVIIRTAAEGASEEDLERDLNRLHAQWLDIEKKAQTAAAPALIYGEPDVVIRVVRDIFNEDFKELVVQGDDEWDTIDNYVRWVAPDLAERARKWTDDDDVFAAYRIDEQLAKALDRKVWLPSGGYLVIDRTEAMIVIDVNTGKFTGKGGNLEETVTKNNIEAAEEIVRQLRLRDLGGIIVIDFIDMVLESNRDLVLRRLMECLGRDRTRHQVAEVTSLGLVQMTRKRVGQGLLEAFSETCKECGGRGVILTHDPVASKRSPKPRPPAGVKAVLATTPAEPAAEPAGEPAGESGAPENGESAGAPPAETAGEPAAVTPKRRSRGGRGKGGGAPAPAAAEVG